MLLAGKVVVVTGSTRGIGRAIVEACAREAARVVVASRKQEAVDATLAELRGQGWQASGIAVDVARPGDLEALLAHAVEAWGRVHVWLNNAGLSSGMRPLPEVTEAEVTEIVAVNLTATINACRLLIPYFMAHGGGVLVNMSGKGGRGEASPNLALYSATKAAVTNLTLSLARENRGRPISIHALIPGMVATDFYRDVATSPTLTEQAAGIPYVLKALGVPAEEVGRAFVRIAAQRPGAVTGKVYSLLGGPRLARGIAQLMWYRMSGKVR